MTRDEAQALIDTYCDDPPLDADIENTDNAVERLMRFDLSDFAQLNEAASGKVQDRLDDILYGNVLVHYGGCPTECGIYPSQAPGVYATSHNHNDATCPHCVKRLVNAGYWKPGSDAYNERLVLSRYP